ncbi:MAG: hypothetical protein IT169_16660 [Bryobacterales bacterium]|nr:hypothetical protein [Bryobacterales bacterium]
MRFLAWLALLLFVALPAIGQPEIAASAAQGSSADLDLDTLPDAFEQALLERFLPRFFVSRNECAELPAEFAADEPEPRAVAANGAIYGQAFPLSGAEGVSVELHYFHLWTTDCGRWGHPLDAEHVSVLLTAPQGDAPPSATPVEEWRARYWYAAAHEDTVCDVSHGAHAQALGAERHGAKIWISRAKHASYLSRERCKFGCGGDECKKPKEIDVPRVINLGEKGRPLNGARFTASSRWPLEQKLGSDFNAAVRQQLAGASPKKIVAVNSALPPVRATILAGEEILSGAGTGKRHTDEALKTGTDATGNALKTGHEATAGALKTSQEATGNALGRAFRATKRFLTGRESPPAATRAEASIEGTNGAPAPASP